MLNGCVYNANDDRQKAVRILRCNGSQVGEGTNEDNFGQTTEADCSECCESTMGQTEAERMNDHEGKTGSNLRPSFDQ
jgi:hypothetical protein